jgi:hypothetical protein
MTTELPEHMDNPNDLGPLALKSNEGLGLIRVGYWCDGRQYTATVPNAPTLTACAWDLKRWAGVEANRTMFMTVRGEPDRRLGDTEAVVLAADGSSQFWGVPNATIGG